MAKSNIIKQLANDEISITVAFNRLLIIASDIGNERLAEWAENELNGYTEKEHLPKYRTLKITDFVYTGINGSFQVTDAPLALRNIFYDENDIAEKCAKTYFLQGISALESMISGQDSILYIDYSWLAPFVHEKIDISCISIKKRIPSNIIENVISSIKTSLLKILIKLDKEYGNLDSLDIDTSNKTEEEREFINATIINYIYNDSSITIGNENKFKDVDISTGSSSYEQEK